METKGNPELKPAEVKPPEQKEESKQEECFRYPPCTQQPLRVQNRITGDAWLGFSPIRTTREVAIAWMTLQIENIYCEINASIEAHQRAIQDGKKNGKTSLRDIIAGPFRRQ